MTGHRTEGVRSATLTSTHEAELRAQPGHLLPRSLLHQSSIILACETVAHFATAWQTEVAVVTLPVAPGYTSRSIQGEAVALATLAHLAVRQQRARCRAEGRKTSGTPSFWSSSPTLVSFPMTISFQVSTGLDLFKNWIVLESPPVEASIPLWPPLKKRKNKKSRLPAPSAAACARGTFSQSLRSWSSTSSQGDQHTLVLGVRETNPLLYGQLEIEQHHRQQGAEQVLAQPRPGATEPLAGSSMRRGLELGGDPPPPGPSAVLPAAFDRRQGSAGGVRSSSTSYRNPWPIRTHPARASDVLLRPVS